MKPIIVSIAGPSGAGKSFLANKLKENNGFKEIVSVTTRNPREGEIDGVHYNFVNEEKFLEMYNNNQLIEYTHVNGNYYGVPASEPLKLAKEGVPIVVVAEPIGIQQIKDYCKKNDWISLEVFVSSPIEVLEQRMTNRQEEQIKQLNVDDPEYNQKKNKIIEANQSRWKHIKEVEFEKWVKPAFSKDSIFNVVFNEFNENNEKTVINSIINKMKELNSLNYENKEEKPKIKKSIKMRM